MRSAIRILDLAGTPLLATGRHFETRDASTAALRGDQIASLTITSDVVAIAR